MKILIMVNTGASDLGVSGGDRIFIEFSKIWSATNAIKIITWPQARRVCVNSGLNKVEFDVVRIEDEKIFLPLLYFERTFIAMLKALTIKRKDMPEMLFSSSDFWPDVIPAFILKLRSKKIKWMAAFYFFAPTPF